MSYDPQNGLLTADTLGNMGSSYSYNSFGELTGTTAAYNSSTLYNRSFTRDSLGRITAVTETIEGETTSYEYAYNEIGYLVQVTKNGAVTASYEYDANGNRTRYAAPDDTLTAVYDEQDRLLTYGDAHYHYGKHGELRGKIAGSNTTYYNYDNIGNLRSVVLPGGTLIEYVIDGKNRRVTKKVNGQVTRWLYAGGLYDHDIGLIRLGARDYNPQTGRWTSSVRLVSIPGSDAYKAGDWAGTAAGLLAGGK